MALTKIKLLSTFILVSFCFGSPAFSQQQDSIAEKRLEAITIEGTKLFSIERLPKTSGTFLWTGKKNEVINVQNLDASIAEKTPRQIFSKVPGVFVYDMDGSGNQTNISTRGLDPHRGWEYNIRKNNIITNSDLYGYPASHYSMPMEAVERIELVRGTGSLQYGSQFGGMLNYVSKTPDSIRNFSWESINSVGSFGLLSTYQGISGTVGKFRYYVYYSKRVSNGYRDNSRSEYDAQSVLLTYAPSKRVDLKLEVVRSNYLYQIPGPLTDSMFRADPTAATRSRNYFNPEIYVPSFTMDYKLGDATRFSWTTSAVLGKRSSVQFDKPATVADVIDPITLEYAQRQVDIDNFNSYTTELRLLHHYALGNVSSILSAGVQLIKNDLNRQQLGKGTRGSDFDLTIDGTGFGRDLHLKTDNIAIFVENAFEVAPQLTITPGARFESGKSDLSGYVLNYDPTELPNSIEHRFILAGLNVDYTFGGHNIYGGWSQGYRPVAFKDVIPGSTYERVDKNLKDATGYNLEVGYRGKLKSVRWDVTAFQLRYNNRMGTLVGEATDDGNFYILRTNVGNSITNGIELFSELDVFHNEFGGMSVFTSTSFMDGEYRDAVIRSGNENKNVSGNKIECVPSVISRNGLTFRYQGLSVSCLYSYTAKSYADAFNTETPTASGSAGLVPSYGIWDLNTSIQVFKNLKVRLNFNNIFDEQYFTKRPQFYPGPGVWSSDGRSVNCTVAVRL
jgi:Fe(3+) dicitrate transport protein